MVKRLLFSLFGFFACSSAALAQHKWPEMAEVSTSVQLQLDRLGVRYDLPLDDTSGHVQYRLICRGAAEELTGVTTEAAAQSWSLPPLTCALFADDREVGRSLLDTKDVHPLHSRGYFGAQSLVGVCTDYPGYGTERHFRLRGFELTLKADDIQYNMDDSTLLEKQYASPVTALRLVVSLRPDSAALSEFAATPAYPDPRFSDDGCRTPQ